MTRRDELRRPALARGRALLSERQGLLQRKIELFLRELSAAPEAIQDHDIRAFAAVQYSRAEDVGTTLT